MFTIRDHAQRWGGLAVGVAAGVAIAGLASGSAASASSSTSVSPAAAHPVRVGAQPGTGAGGRAGQGQPLIAPVAPRTITPDTLPGYSSVYFQFDSPPGHDWAYVNCPSGQFVLGGGPQVVAPSNNWNIVMNTSFNIGNGWYVTFTNTTNTTVSIWVDAVCD